MDRAGRSPFHYAALEGDTRRIAELMEAGEELDSPDFNGFTALHFAAQEYQVDAARMLLDQGAQVDLVNDFGNTPLFVAVANSLGRGDLIALLRERGADVLHANFSGQTPIGLARLIGNFDVAQFFSDIDDIDAD